MCRYTISISYINYVADIQQAFFIERRNNSDLELKYIGLEIIQSRFEVNV